jgi:D-serine deaminase-like pyridoxal phosphate-dependent protein
MKQVAERYYFEDDRQVDTPALVVYPRYVRENIELAIRMAGGPERLRPHIKTHKTLEGVKAMMLAGINRFKCATIAEAELLGIAGAGDTLLAYQPTGPKLKRLVELILHYPSTRYSCLVDRTEAAVEMNEVFASAGLQVRVYLDINLGQNRTGISPDNSALALYKLCSQLKGIEPVGLHGYDGHIRDRDLEVRRTKCDAAFERLVTLKTQIVQQDFTPPTIIVGGSPTFSIHSTREGVECSPGTFIFWDKGYTDLCPEQPFIPAVLVLSRVISLPDKSKICLDLGHKSIGAENELARRVYFLNAPELVPVSQSEEHLVMEAGEGHPYRIGDLLYGIPFHVCPTVALYERACAVENGQIAGEWRVIARDRKIHY